MRAFAAGAILVLPLIFVALSGGAEAATTSQALTISTATAHPLVAFQNFDGNPPKLFDVNGDGQLEIIAQNDNQWVYVFDSKTGAILAQVKTNFPSGWGARSFNGPEVAVFDSAGTVRLVLQNSAAMLSSWRFDPGASTGTSFKFVKEWERRLSDCFVSPGSDSKPVLADLDKDGKYEILASTEESGLYAIRQDGQLYWKKCIGGGNAEMVVADLNLDGWLDVVYGSDGGVVTAMQGRTGATMWSYWATGPHNLGSGSMPVGVGIGQLDGRGGPDIVVGARDSHNATDFSQDHALLLALDSAGRLLWAKQDLVDGNPLTYTHPVIVDAAGDGTNEVYWADWNTIGHKPPANEADSWKVTGPGHFYRYDNNGNLVWKQTLGTYWNNKDLTLADVDGDGVQEVLANGPGSGGDGIWYLDSRTGAKETFIPTTHWKVSREPVIADLWGTGTMQWVVEVSAADSTVSGGGILVYDTHAVYNSVYPHLPYPTLAAAPPPPPPPPPGATFDATFTVKSPNEWWQEVTVAPSPPRTVAKMDIRIAGAFWEPMTKSSWGAWTASRHAPAGTTVEFLATDPGGAASQSAPFTWMDGTLTKPSVSPGTAPPPPPPPPPATTFAATFEPTANINEWWVDVKVRTGEPLAGVDVRVNGGAWIALSATSWDTWAKSVNAPRGSTVQLRATSTFGATATSPDITWMGAGTAPAVTFQPMSQTNNWWVEAKVTAPSTIITKVEASTNGGAWTSLPATNWSTWAKSYFVADGAKVQFRATNDVGNAALSDVYVWG